MRICNEVDNIHNIHRSQMWNVLLLSSLSSNWHVTMSWTEKKIIIHVSMLGWDNKKKKIITFSCKDRITRKKNIHNHIMLG